MTACDSIHTILAVMPHHSKFGSACLHLEEKVADFAAPVVVVAIVVAVVMLLFVLLLLLFFLT